MKRISKLNIIALILNIILMVALILGLFNLSKTGQDYAQMEDEHNLPSAEMNEEMNSSDELTIWIENMKSLAEQYGVSTYFLQQLFPNQIVYSSQGHYMYAEVDPTLAQHSYNWDFLSTDENGILQYADPNGVQGTFGIDVSKYQGEIDWTKVKEQGVQFAFLRAGYRGYETGAIMEDEFLQSYLEGATEADIPVGLYFFSQAVSVEEAIEEADFAIDAAAGYDIQYPIVFDMEEIADGAYRTETLTASQITDIAIAFCERVRERGYTPMIYGNVGFLLGRMELSRLQQYDIWFAQYRDMPYFPYQFSMWQYTAQGSIDGIAGDVDINIGFKDFSA